MSASKTSWRTVTRKSRCTYSRIRLASLPLNLTSDPFQSLFISPTSSSANSSVFICLSDTLYGCICLRGGSVGWLDISVLILY